MSNVIKGPWVKQWAPVPGFYRYVVSNHGEIYDTRYDEYVDGKVDSTGDVRIDFLSRSQPYSTYLYVLVARLFLPNYSSALQTKHRDGDKTNNKVDNLYQIGIPRPKPKVAEVKPSAAIKDAKRNPSKPSPTPGKAREVAVYKDGKFVKIFKNVNTLAKSLGVAASTVYQALDHPTRKCQGLSFETYYGEDNYAK